MFNTCVPVVLAAKPAVHLAARVVRRVARRVVGHGRRPSNAAAQAKLAAPKAVHAPTACVKGAALAAMKAAAVAGWLGAAGAAGYAAADVAAGGTTGAVATPSTGAAALGPSSGPASRFAPAAVEQVAMARPAAMPAVPLGTTARTGQAPSEADSPAAPETAAQPTPAAVSDTSAALALEASPPAETVRLHPGSAPGPVTLVSGALPLSASPPTQVAEPGSLVLLAAGLLCSAALRTRSRHRA